MEIARIVFENPHYGGGRQRLVLQALETVGNRTGLLAAVASGSAYYEGWIQARDG